MKAAIYARVSDDKKKSDGTRRQDVHRQVEIIKERIERCGHTVDEKHIYIDDGKSAFTEALRDRPEFRRMMRDARAHWVDTIYVESLDRFSRKLTMGLQWLEQLSKAGCTVVSLHEGEIDVTEGEGWMRSALFLLMAEWYSRELSRKVKSGMARSNKKAGRPRKVKKS